ncbi:hypothetical protein HAHE_23240 [Haloferula helveola]|uniref:Uncharacterized protein n=1 Tax=Haloferula helveola TaxID=490095 RepID=A0ABM7RGJ6_9BACT|nr:hypothetical protein HAHE_23240 [Haloferula helveola]
MDPAGSSDSSPPGLPPPPPKIETGKLWLSLLLPQGFLVASVILMLLPEFGIPHGGIIESFAIGGLQLFWISGIICWVKFGQVVNRRFQGTGAVLMILGYPIAQVSVGLALFFGICMAGMALA